MLSFEDNPIDAIEITTERIEGDEDSLSPFLLIDAAEGWASRSEMVSAVYAAMELARRGPR